MKTYITSDWHLGHKMLVEKNYRQDNYEWIIWDDLIKLDSNDLLINLGDVEFGFGKEKLRHFLSWVKAKKILVRGNHDMSRSKTFWINVGFDFVCDMFVLDNVLFTHKPELLHGGEIKYNIHGHLHDGTLHKDDWQGDQMNYLISMEKNNYKCYDFSKIKKEKNKK